LGKEKSLDEQLTERLKAIRNRSGRSRREVAKCMEIGIDTLRLYENANRPLPDFLHGLIAWVKKFLECVDATPDEQQEVLILASRLFVEKFAGWKLDDENRRSRKPRP
jgi:transcriptional regulator with XRE-family HTH domain